MTRPSVFGPEDPQLVGQSRGMASNPDNERMGQESFSSTKILVTEQRSSLRPWIVQGVFGDKPPQEL
jgi:hypothetical protein